MSSPGLIPTFSTAVNIWQCDENNHLNVQYYTEFGHEASAHLLASLGLGPRAQRSAGLTIGVAEDHVRYLRGFTLDDPAVRSVVLRGLKRLATALASGDGDAAAKAMRVHLENARTILLEKMGAAR